MEEYIRRAVANITKHGDTDIFPFPIENHVFFDKTEEVVALIKQRNVDVRGSLATNPPQNVGALAPAGYAGFRWATQIDPFWNAAYLGWVLAIAEEIESVRVPTSESRVFSYRYKWDENEKNIFDRSIGWRSFTEAAIRKSVENKIIVACDISEFYLRINHHRIENAIRHLPNGNDIADRIQPFLSNFSKTYSFGLPIGGPASRILAELVMNQVDSLLIAEGIDFLRFVDDYYIFAENSAEAFKNLVTLTRILIENQGLQLQKSKTRIMTTAEFVATNPLVHDDGDAEVEAPLGEARQAVMSISLHFDPYSSTAQEDYSRLKEEIGKYPIIDLIRSELTKSRVNISLTKKLVSIIRHMDGDSLDESILTIISNDELLYPIYFNVLMCTHAVWSSLSENTKETVQNQIFRLVSESARVMQVDVNLQYAVRLLAMVPSERTKQLFHKLFRSEKSELVGADIIIGFLRWQDWHWLSALKNRFRTLLANQRRAFIIASFSLGDEGAKWRNHVKRELSDDEIVIREWANDKSKIDGWIAPL
jgi:hypothetical protein